MATTDPGDGFIEGLPESVASLMGHCRNKIIKKEFSVNHQDLPLLQNAFRVQPLPSIPSEMALVYSRAEIEGRWEERYMFGWGQGVC